MDTNLDEIKQLLQDNLAQTKEVKQLAEQIKKYMFWSRVMRVIYLLLIIVPIILGILYLPPFIEDILGQLNPQNNGQGYVENLLKALQQ